MQRTLTLALLAGATLTLVACSSSTTTMSTAAATPARANIPDALISRDILAGNPERASLRLSPDGKQLLWLQPVNNVMNVFVAPASDPSAARQLTKDSGRGIRQASWAYDSATVLYLQDQGGDENWKIHAVDLASGTDRDLTPFSEIQGPDGKPIMLPSGKPLRPAAQIEATSAKFPTEIIVGLNNRNPEFHDLYRVNITTGAMTLLLKNDGFAGYTIDDSFNVRMATRSNADGSMDLLKAQATGSSIEFVPFETIPDADSLTTSVIGFDKTGESVYWFDSRGRNTSAVFSQNLTTGKKSLIAANPKADAGAILTHPTEKTIQAVSFEYDRTAWQIIDPAIKGDLDYLRTVADGDIRITSRSLDDKTWTVAYLMDNGPVRTYVYDRTAKKANFIFTSQPKLESLPLAKMHPEIITSRDGLNLVSYLTLPRWTDTDNNARPDAGVKPLPLVLLVHGGPWARDNWGYDPETQWLANRGYAVLQVNFRGSTGFGKEFTNAGNREWAGKMHDDLIDAVNWSVSKGIADKSRVAIMGTSYGGYATLVGLTFTPEVFAAGVCVVGPSNINTLLSTIPPYWKPLMAMFNTRVGDSTTAEGKAFLDSRSPLTRVDQIQRPLLIGQGANDPRVKQSESDQIVRAMQAKNIPVTYVLYPDEGHGFARPENRGSFNAVTEAFLAQHLGGRVEPVGDDFTGSSITVPAGAELVPGIKEALKQ